MTYYVSVLLALTIVLLLILALTLLRVHFMLVVVEGTSMQPKFHPGDRVLVRRRVSKLVRHSVVVFPPPPQSRTPHLSGAERGTAQVMPHLVIKRLAAVGGDSVPASVLHAVGGVPLVPNGQVVVLADNRTGSDSRQWGFVPAGTIRGIVVAKLS
jgi:signal peptidase I